MRVLIVGGTGLISSEVARSLLGAGHDVTLVNRGSGRQTVDGAKTIVADATDAHALRDALHGMRLRRERFDVVLQSIAFQPDHVADDVETFAPLTDRYALIATSAAYAKHDTLHRLVEDDEQDNPYWDYAQAKIACEQVLRERAPQAGLDWVIVRPAHTYGDPKMPGYWGNSSKPWTLIDRMRRGADILIPGDGSSLWTLTHASDVGAGIAGVITHSDASHRAVHVVSDTPYTWETILRTIAVQAGLSEAEYAAQRICVPTDAVVAAVPEAAGGLYGDKMHQVSYDNSLLKELVPGWEPRMSLEDGIASSIAWFEADESRRAIDDATNAVQDRLARIYRAALAQAADG